MIKKWTRSVGGRIRHALLQADKLACNDNEKIFNTQLFRLQAVWDDAVINIPYYHALVKSHSAPRQIRSIEEFFEVVPILTKKIVMASPTQFRRKEKPDSQMMTAGSTGEPFHFGVYKSETDFSAININAMRYFRGMDIVHDRLLLFWGHSYLLGTGFLGKIKSQERKLKDWMLDYRRLDAYHMGRRTARDYFDVMLKTKPQVVCGYSNAVDLFVRHNLDRAQKAKSLGIKFVVCTSEMLPKPASFEIIEDFFGAPLMMEYGGVDFGAVAHKWRNLPYIVNWWDYLCEGVHNFNNDERASLLLTTLYPRYLPLIRYDTGDEISYSQKRTNGQILQFMQLEGRYHDIIILDGDVAIHSMGLLHCIHQESSVANIQLIIEQDALRILLIGEQCNAAVDRIRKRLLNLSPQFSNCSIEYVDDLLTTRAGKRRWIIDRRRGN